MNRKQNIIVLLVGLFTTDAVIAKTHPHYPRGKNAKTTNSRGQNAIATTRGQNAQIKSNRAPKGA